MYHVYSLSGEVYTAVSIDLSWISNPGFSVYGHSLLAAIQLLDQGISYSMGIPLCYLEAYTHSVIVRNLYGFIFLFYVYF